MRSRRFRKYVDDSALLTIGLKFGDLSLLQADGDQVKWFFETLVFGIRNLNLSDVLSELGVFEMEAFNPKLLFKDMFGDAANKISLYTGVIRSFPLPFSTAAMMILKISSWIIFKISFYSFFLILLSQRPVGMKQNMKLKEIISKSEKRNLFRRELWSSGQRSLKALTVLDFSWS